MHDSPSYKKTLGFYSLLLFSGCAYFVLAYKTVRSDFTQVISLFAILFAAYFFLYRFFSASHFTHLLIVGILFRLLLVFSVPNLSDDVYRFIWDGRLAANGINPFSHLPVDVMQRQALPGITRELYFKLNSPQYYTVYPPVLQGLFWLSAKLCPVNVFDAIVFMKGMIWTVELATLFVIIQLLKKLLLPMHLSLLYILNPLVITELTANAHFDGVMILFVLLSFLFLLQYNWPSSAVCLAVGIATKLLPVLFLPLIIHKLGWKTGLKYLLFAGLTTVIFFALVFDVPTISHLLMSVDLFMRQFEFNASLYYVVRYIGEVIKGYNTIAIAGPALLISSAIIILLISFKEKHLSWQSFFIRALFIASAWFLFSTTVHPWYICLPVALSVFTPYRYGIIWSFTATLSYAAYQYHPVKENVWLVGAGYAFMCGYAWWEIRIKKHRTILPA